MAETPKAAVVTPEKQSEVFADINPPELPEVTATRCEPSRQGEQPAPLPEPLTAEEDGLIRLAVSQRWPIRNDKRRTLAARLEAIVAHPLSTERQVTRAGRLLAQLDRLNQQQEQYDEARPEIHRIEITPAALDDAAVRLAQWRQSQQQAIGEFLASLNSPPVLNPPTPMPSTNDPAS